MKRRDDTSDQPRSRLLGHQWEPHDVFTPGGIPLAESNVYVARDEAESGIDRSLRRNWCPVLYGDYGVGKTTLILRYFADREESGRLVYVPTASGLEMPKLFELLLEKLDYSVETERKLTDSESVDGSFNLTVVKVGAKSSGDKSVTRRLVVTSPTDPTVIRLINEAELSIVIDEMHTASDTFRSELASFIKSTRVAAPKIDLVFVGTSADALRLVSSDPGIDRFIKDTHVPLMSPAESAILVRRGFSRLRIEVSDAVVDLMVEVSAGAPSILQSLCLDAAESVVSSGRKRVQREHLVEAVQRYLADNSGRMLRKYYGAIETQGIKRYRKQVLIAAAMHDNDYVTMEDLRRAVSKALGEDVIASALSGPLRDLKTPEYGEVLKDVERGGGRNRIQNVTSFTDPMMKSFVRFITTLDKTRIVPEDEGRELMGIDE